MKNNRRATFYDGFTNKSDRWHENAFSYHYKGSYHLYPRSLSNDFSWISLHKAHTFRDFIYEAEVNWVEGRTNIGYGLAFRSNNKDNTYVFTITRNKFYSLGLFKRGQYRILCDWEESQIMNENKSNIISVACSGRNITAYLNNCELVTIKDSTYDKGHFGFYSGANVHSRYNNVRITEMSKDEFISQ